MASYDERKTIFETIKVLAKPEQEEIFRIIRKLKVTYSENSNGVFFDLASISDESFEQIKEYIQFCLTNRKEHEDRLKELDIIRHTQYTSN
uniref:NET domain-containing protein n=1 Tax=viral metagenome TaxID=1070528 RepID=A0A6C0HJ22_9ZZZZ